MTYLISSPFQTVFFAGNPLPSRAGNPLHFSSSPHSHWRPPNKPPFSSSSPPTSRKPPPCRPPPVYPSPQVDSASLPVASDSFESSLAVRLPLPFLTPSIDIAFEQVQVFHFAHISSLLRSLARNQRTKQTLFDFFFSSSHSLSFLPFSPHSNPRRSRAADRGFVDPGDLGRDGRHRGVEPFPKRRNTFLNVVALSNVGARKSAALSSVIGHPVLPTGENGAIRAPICIDLQRDSSVSSSA